MTRSPESASRSQTSFVVYDDLVQVTHPLERRVGAVLSTGVAANRVRRPLRNPAVASLGYVPARVQHQQQTNGGKGRKRCQHTYHGLPSFISTVTSALSRRARPLYNLRHSGESRKPEGRCNGDAQALRPDSQRSDELCKHPRAGEGD